ncbi:transglycosylase SLT domain-containing protein [Rhodanobacter denitrificans]|uniref:Putative soluble lytic transglycosylase fused to an ABC-type amino acid-binding protein n=1 Tax=Rhodanobacter denitrificans TaxID=666685 RepID=M4NG88_9GAMM|nr:transglycosylase SLT domain-containing protein [Rhodanobacter denitrificans]AGG89909.1 putative soluble lytic transglycosylase fused to an ABC-type amino acid-binding protein [Rhodanobacter denitrificans]UJM85305.1 transglycosylase SLT domain-containing protein [Rhodanobacter denitrificans]
MIGALLLLLLGGSFIYDATTRRMWGFLPPPRWQTPVGIGMCVAGLILLATVASAAPAKPAAAAHVRVAVPEVNTMYRRYVEQAVAEEWGVEGSPARLAAQIHQESSWNAKARSPVGAEGLAQFMPSTGAWIAEAFPDKLGQFDPWDPQQAALAAAVYDAWLVKRNPGTTQCDSWAFGLSAYNGGEKRLHQEMQLAERKRLDAGTWFGSVSDQRARSAAAWRENRGYVRRILLVLEPAYLDAGWSGKEVCA